jgi:capsular polysaccharide export protein
VNKISSLENKRILFLQGPMGTFFKRLDTNFRKQGAVTFKIGFNMGDRFFSYQDNYVPFSDMPTAWPEFIARFLEENQIEMIFLFGDCRYYQRITRQIAYEKQIEVYVFEEGYLRPHYITLEKFGVNGFSNLPRKAAFYYGLPLKKTTPPQHSHPSKTKMIVSATIYYALSNLFTFRYPHYHHHRDFSAIKEAFYGVRGLLRKGLYALVERRYLPLLTKQLSGKYYFVPLQTHNDFQVLQHSHYRSIEKFIIEVLESFSYHAPKNTYLVFKHHPVDRGRRNYRKFIQEQAELLAIEKRIIIIHDVHLPSCLKNAIGTVTINSTVGLSAIGYDKPTIVMGNAIYDIEGLSNKGTSLRKFWHQHKKPDCELYQKFKQYLIQNTQLNGSFYGMMPKELQS